MRYINSSESKTLFEFLLRSPYFVDKTGLIGKLCPLIGTENRYVCVTRPRRFGKTANARMLACFLSKNLGASSLFTGLIVSQNRNAMAHLGTHDVIYLDFSLMPQDCENINDYLDLLRAELVEDLIQHYPGCPINKDADLFSALQAVHFATETRFCFIIDEWDSMFFNPQFTTDDQQVFLLFLKQLLKSRAYVDFAYMTGVLPIAKHSTGSELNTFVEYTAADDPRYEQFFGFTEQEVHALVNHHVTVHPDARVNFDGLAHWYNGYCAKDGTRLFNPRSVVLALLDDDLRSYWTESGPYDEIYYYVKHNVGAVRDDLVRMVGGESVRANVSAYSATSRELSTKDEIFSAMVVYGFLTYRDGAVSIPNHELMLRFQNVLAKEEMGYVARLAQRSHDMLTATLAADTQTMEEIIQGAHDQEVPLLRYANESDLGALVNLVYLAARDRYWVRREEPAGRGIADVAFIPKDASDAQAVPFIVELKCGGTTAEALSQIRERGYGKLFADGLLGETPGRRPLAVAIAWEPASKKHAAAVEPL